MAVGAGGAAARGPGEAEAWGRAREGRPGLHGLGWLEREERVRSLGYPLAVPASVVLVLHMWTGRHVFCRTARAPVAGCCASALFITTDRRACCHEQHAWLGHV